MLMNEPPAGPRPLPGGGESAPSRTPATTGDGPVEPPGERELAAAIWRNLSGIDRSVRILAGAAMLAFAWSGAASGITAATLQVFGWVPLVTGIAGWDPFYAVLGFSTIRWPNGRAAPPRRAASAGRRTLPGHRRKGSPP